MSNSTPQTPRTKPKALQTGDTVGIVAPASNIKRELLEQGCEALRLLGYKPFYLDSILEQDLYFAGSPKRRARELEEMFTRDNVRAIVCARGGYGANYLLGELDPAKIAGHPKIFVGYSDITTLLTCGGRRGAPGHQYDDLRGREALVRREAATVQERAFLSGGGMRCPGRARHHCGHA